MRWKAYERRVARLLGTQRIPVTGERAGADAETPLLAVQCKQRGRIPGYLLAWLDGIRRAAERREKVGIVVMQRPHGDDLDSLVVLSLRDWLELHGPVRVGTGAELPAAAASALGGERCGAGPYWTPRSTPGP